ncbi:MAG: ATPase, T2SS/T4P/T4SS family [Patescibacteria group bacterium]
MRVEETQLKNFLGDSGIITPAALQKAVKEAEAAGKPLRDTLLNGGYIPEEALRRLEAYILGIPFVDLTREKIDPDVLRSIPEPIAKKHNIIAFKRGEGSLEVAMLDPDDLQTIEFIKKKEGIRILPRLTTPESIKSALLQYQKTLEAEFGDIITKESGALTVAAHTEEAEPEDLKKMAEDLPIIRIVDTLVRHAILQSASDIHIEPLEKEVLVRYRIDGILHEAMVLPRQVAPGIVARIKVMSNLRLDEHRLPQDGRFKIETEEYKISFRVSILPVYTGEKIVLRLLPESGQKFTLDELGFWGLNLERIEHAIKRPTGIILATGPTGSGKTTTLYTVLEMLNSPRVNISTIEDPIEYRMPRINQSQVHADIGFTFANGLRSLLRQDPNVLMVGEIRDKETAALAINASLTGHLVLSTLHTNSAAGALPRLIDMGIEPFLIASTVSAIISQRLVRRLCEEKDVYTLSEPEQAALSKDVPIEAMIERLKKEKVIGPKAAPGAIEWARPRPSDDCPEGYKGRIGIHEVLEVTPTIRELIMKNEDAERINKQAEDEGMISMLTEGIIRAAQHVTSIEEVLRVTRE